MGKHGLVTWGPDSKTCYETTLRIIGEAQAYLDAHAEVKPFGGPAVGGGFGRGAAQSAARLVACVAGSDGGNPQGDPGGRLVARGHGVRRLAGGGRAMRRGGGLSRPPRPHQARPLVPGLESRRGIGRAHREGSRRRSAVQGGLRGVLRGEQRRGRRDVLVRAAHRPDPRRRHGDERRRRDGGGGFAATLSAGDPGDEVGDLARRLRVARRRRVVRHRVLAAGALQAESQACARRPWRGTSRS